MYCKVLNQIHLMKFLLMDRIRPQMVTVLLVLLSVSSSILVVSPSRGQSSSPVSSSSCGSPLIPQIAPSPKPTNCLQVDLPESCADGPALGGTCTVNGTTPLTIHFFAVTCSPDPSQGCLPFNVCKWVAVYGSGYDQECDQYVWSPYRDGSRFIWIFGDGEASTEIQGETSSSTDISASSTSHTYTKPGVFSPALVLYNDSIYNPGSLDPGRSSCEFLHLCTVIRMKFSDGDGYTLPVKA